MKDIEYIQVPKQINGMNLIKKYPNIVLYGNSIRKESFTYFDLGINTIQFKNKKTNI